ncbi:hypothetical protein Csa_019061 [Cucumis sativus]|nr:hypothetical protein Csa_019061 [Cucumis sativus]
MGKTGENRSWVLLSVEEWLHCWKLFEKRNGKQKKKKKKKKMKMKMKKKKKTREEKKRKDGIWLLQQSSPIERIDCKKLPVTENLKSKVIGPTSGWLHKFNPTSFIHMPKPKHNCFCGSPLPSAFLP